MRSRLPPRVLTLGLGDTALSETDGAGLTERVTHLAWEGSLVTGFTGL